MSSKLWDVTPSAGVMMDSYSMCVGFAWQTKWKWFKVSERPLTFWKKTLRDSVLEEEKNSSDSQEHISSGRSSRRKTDTKRFLLSVGKESRFLQVACCACKHQPLVYIKHTARVTAHNTCCHNGCDKHPQGYSFRSPALKPSDTFISKTFKHWPHYCSEQHQDCSMFNDLTIFIPCCYQICIQSETQVGTKNDTSKDRLLAWD